MQHTTLCLLIKDRQILLAMKKRGFGQGKWNGIGGKIHEGESIQSSALRELKEEIGVTVSQKHLSHAGYIQFFFDDHPDWNQDMNIFLVKTWIGEPQESEEMKPCWYRFQDIPYHEMWVGDKHWLPLILEGKTIKGEFHFNEDGSQLNNFKIES